MARREIEQRLQEAEHSLARLEKAVKGEKNDDQIHVEENSTKEELMGDVRTLKSKYATA